MFHNPHPNPLEGLGEHNWGGLGALPKFGKMMPSANPTLFKTVAMSPPAPQTANPRQFPQTMVHHKTVEQPWGNFTVSSARKPPSLEGGGSAVLSSCVGVSIGVLKDTTMLIRNALDGATSGFDVETARTSDSHSSHVSTCFFSSRNHRFHHVSCLKTVYFLLSRFRACSRKTVTIHATHLPTSPSHRSNLQHFLREVHAHSFS